MQISFGATARETATLKADKLSTSKKERELKKYEIAQGGAMVTIPSVDTWASSGARTAYIDAKTSKYEGKGQEFIDKKYSKLNKFA